MNAIKRINEILTLKDGWFDGEGKAITPEARRNLELFLQIIRKFDLKKTALFPQLEGGLQLEWKEAELHFNEDGSIHILLDEDDDIKVYRLTLLREDDNT